MAKVFTIGRQLGSKGWEIGQKLSSELNIPFYNDELIELSANKSGMSADIFATISTNSCVLFELFNTPLSIAFWITAFCFSSYLDKSAVYA